MADANEKEGLKPMLRILKHLRWKNSGCSSPACVVLIVGQVQLDFGPACTVSEITRLVQTEGSQMSDILLAGGKMLLCALGSMLLTVCTTFFTAQIASRFSARLRGEMYRKVVGFSNEEINRFSTASLITRTTNDISQLQMFFSFGMQSLIKAPIMAFIAVGKISTKSREMVTADRRRDCVRVCAAGLHHALRRAAHEEDADADGQPEPHHA